MLISESRVHVPYLFSTHFSSCDTTSAFNGKGKKSAWKAWQAYKDVTETLAHLTCHPFEKLNRDSKSFMQLERLTVILYDRTSSLEATKELFCQKNKPMEKRPPTQDALLEHARRTVYQAGIWTTSAQSKQAVPSPQEFTRIPL